MKAPLFEVRVPELGVNDREATVVELLVPDLAAVAAGDELARLETTKAVFELQAEVGGLVRWFVAAGELVSIQSVIAVIGRDRAAVEAVEPPDRGAPRATRKARELAEQHGIAIEAIEIGGERVVREADVRRWIEGRSPAEARAAEPAPTWLSNIAVLNATEGGLLLSAPFAR